MPKFYTNDDGSGGDQTYEVFSDKPRGVSKYGENQYPYGYLIAQHNRGSYIPNFASDDDETFRHSDPQNITGLSSEYLSHLMEKKPQDRPGVSRILDELDDVDDSFVFDKDTRNKFNARKDLLKTQIQQHPAFNPETLFTEIEPPHTEIIEMYADPSMSVHMPTLTTLAYLRGGRMPIKPSSDLSPYSSRLAKKLGNLNVPSITNPDNPENEITNESVKRPMTMEESLMTNEGHGREGLIPQGEVAQARQELRSILRSGKTRNPTPITGTSLSDQMLPGMERYM